VLGGSGFGALRLRGRRRDRKSSTNNSARRRYKVRACSSPERRSILRSLSSARLRGGISRQKIGEFVAGVKKVSALGRRVGREEGSNGGAGAKRRGVDCAGEETDAHELPTKHVGV